MPRPAAAAGDELDLGQRFAGLDTAPALLLAVSGGPDSMALMHLASRWRSSLTRGPRLHVATVDHGLRPEAAAEAELVSGVAGAGGLPHATLAWIGPKPSSGIQAKARAARYHLLAEHARALEAPFVLTAHHADDQAETVLMRLGRGSGVAGLAAMRRRSPLAPGVELVRPLLDVSRQALLEICRVGGLAFVHDPSNDDLAFHRVRLRRQADGAATLGLDPPALRRLARRMARADEALEAEVDRLVAALQAEVAPGLWRAGLEPLRAAAPEIVQRLLGRAVLHVSEAGLLPLEKLETLADALRDAHGARRPFRGTLAGAMVALDAAGTLAVTPAPARRPRPD